LWFEVALPEFHGFSRHFVRHVSVSPITDLFSSLTIKTTSPTSYCHHTMSSSVNRSQRGSGASTPVTTVNLKSLIASSKYAIILSTFLVCVFLFRASIAKQHQCDVIFFFVWDESFSQVFYLFPFSNES
jgi:hypothetical protein